MKYLDRLVIELIKHNEIEKAIKLSKKLKLMNSKSIKI